MRGDVNSQPLNYLLCVTGMTLQYCGNRDVLGSTFHIEEIICGNVNLNFVKIVIIHLKQSLFTRIEYFRK